MKQNRQFTCYCNDSSILSLLTPASCQMESPLSKGRVLSMWSEYMGLATEMMQFLWKICETGFSADSR
jgi:hypothetical protein